MEKQWKQWETLFFLVSKITADGDCSHDIKRHLLLGRKAMSHLDSTLKSKDYFVDKGPSSQSYGFSSSHVWMWELDYTESWALKNWCFWTVVLEKTLKSPLDYKEIKPVNPKGNQSWIFIGRTDAEAETLILWPPVPKNSHWKRPWCWERLKARGDRDDRWWDGWMVSLARWTWVWASSGSWWWTGKSGMLQSMGSQRVRHNWATELNTSIPNSLTIPYPHPPLRFVLSLRTHEDIKASCAGNLSSGKEEKRHNLGRKGRRWPRKSSQRNWLII